jgi:lipoprotein-anchoring transpeptidase ErfK/SrfK
LTILIIGNLLVTQGYADDVSIQPLTGLDCDKAEMTWDESANVCIANSADVSRQPLTRLDCEKARMPWNDNANVCGAASHAAEALPKSDVAEPLPKSEKADALFQPLTRSECDKAGMTWNDTTNVCGEKSEESATQTASKETNSIVSTVLINVDKATQKMTVFLDGVQQHEWPVSTGLAGYTTPSGTYTTSSMNKIWYSREWDNAPMFHAIFFTKRGHAIHGTLEEKKLGKAASHGCVRISRANAETLFALVAQNGLETTQVVLTGTTLGGEGKVASPARSKSRYGRAARGDEWFYAKPRRGGFFGRLFGRR